MLKGLSGEVETEIATTVIETMKKVSQPGSNDIKRISVMKKGMTNQSFLIFCKDKKYIMRIPGVGTDLIINRKEEAAVYWAICNKGICDNIVYINPENGYKITEYLENARTCNPLNRNDVKKCMEKLRQVHKMKLQVEHEFDIYKKIDLYESFLSEKGFSSKYKDYKQTKESIFELQRYINKYSEEKILTHIDAVSDNFLFVKDGKGVEEIRLIDWEYAGMQDPHVDIAMFGIYSMYNRRQMEGLIQEYFQGNCPDYVKTKIYCYIAACGLLWSNWCEYKSSLGVTFGEYALCQYQYAKEYYNVVKNELVKEG